MLLVVSKYFVFLFSERVGLECYLEAMCWFGQDLDVGILALMDGTDKVEGVAFALLLPGLFR
jgi:hypothetical protein